MLYVYFLVTITAFTLTDMLSGSMASQPMPAAFWTRASMMPHTLWEMHVIHTHTPAEDGIKAG